MNKKRLKYPEMHSLNTIYEICTKGTICGMPFDQIVAFCKRPRTSMIIALILTAPLGATGQNALVGGMVQSLEADARAQSEIGVLGDAIFGWRILDIGAFQDEPALMSFSVGGARDKVDGNVPPTGYIINYTGAILAQFVLPAELTYHWHLGSVVTDAGVLRLVLCDAKWGRAYRGEWDEHGVTMAWKRLRENLTPENWFPGGVTLGGAGANRLVVESFYDGSRRVECFDFSRVWGDGERESLWVREVPPREVIDYGLKCSICIDGSGERDETVILDPRKLVKVENRTGAMTSLWQASGGRVAHSMVAVQSGTIGEGWFLFSDEKEGVEDRGCGGLFVNRQGRASSWSHVPYGPGKSEMGLQLGRVGAAQVSDSILALTTTMPGALVVQFDEACSFSYVNRLDDNCAFASKATLASLGHRNAKYPIAAFASIFPDSEPGFSGLVYILRGQEWRRVRGYGWPHCASRIIPR